MNYTTISFPFFGIEWNPDRILTIGPLSIHYYGILIALGLLLAIIYAWRRYAQFGLKESDITDGVLWIVPFAVVCARLYYCIFQWETYASNPIKILYIWEGGLAIYGGVIGAAIGVVIHCRLIKKIPIATVMDLVALGFLIGQSIGRWGNFFNREAFGAETDIFLKMGLLNTSTMTVEYHHPTFLYESLWNAIGFVALHFLSKRRQYDGQIALGYVAWYGLGRTLIEGLRTDSLYLGVFRISQVLAAVSCLAALGVLCYQMLNTHDPKNLYVNKVAAKAAAEAAEATAEEAVEATAEEVVEEAVEATAEEVVEETTEETTEEA